MYVGVSVSVCMHVIIILCFLASHLDYDLVTGLSPSLKCPGYNRKHEPPALELWSHYSQIHSDPGW